MDQAYTFCTVAQQEDPSAAHKEHPTVSLKNHPSVAQQGPRSATLQ